MTALDFSIPTREWAWIQNLNVQMTTWGRPSRLTSILDESTFLFEPLSHLTRTEVYSDPYAKSRWRGCVPFLIRLRDYEGGTLPPLPEFAVATAKSTGRAPSGWSEEAMKSGRAILLIDGVDEVPPSERKGVRKQLAELVARYPNCYYLISTRPASVPEGWLADLEFREATVTPMSDLDRNQFVDRWHTAVAHELGLAGKPSSEIESLAEALKNDLAGNPSIARLATNPLLAAMICALNRDRRSRMPESQRELLEALCHMLLHRRERESGLDIPNFQGLS